jgi:hypothetical protein
MHWFHAAMCAEDMGFTIQQVTAVECGIPSDFKKKMFGKVPIPECCLCLKEGAA